MPKEISAAPTQMWTWCRPAGGTLTLLQPMCRAMLGTCRVYCESLMHSSVLYVLCVWAKETKERQKEKQKIGLWKIFSPSEQDGGHPSEQHSLFQLVIKLTLTVIYGVRRRSLVGWLERQPGRAGDHRWKLTVCWKRNNAFIDKGCTLFPSYAAMKSCCC